MTFAVIFSLSAKEDLERLFDFLLNRAETVEDLDMAQSAIAAVQVALLTQLSRSSFGFGKSGSRSTRREPVIPFGATGHVALNEIAGPPQVVILAIRHQREETCR